MAPTTDTTAKAREPRVLAIDAGGTMTDTFIVDRLGDFVVGKAQSTPADESVGFMASTRDALGQWDLGAEAALPAMMSGIYSGTAMLNRLLERKGRRIGLLVSAGHEDVLQLERGIQTYLGFSYADRLHVATHHHNVPLVPRERIRGVPGRIDLFGDEVIPLYEHDVRRGVGELLEQEVEGLVVCLLYSYRNPVHEARVGEIVRELSADVPLFLSSELYPLRRELPRLNSTMIEAYAAEPSRVQLERVRSATTAAGATFDLRVMAAHGGTISIDAKELGRTLISGPIGGVVGARHLGAQLDLGNILCTDIGGTSFDIALITGGDFQIKPVPDIDRYLLNLPLVQIDSIGAGTGSFVRIDVNSGRPELGPDSAGAGIGVCWEGGGLDTPTVTDLDLVLGRVNPDYFLGGQIALDPERARAAVDEQLARPLGLGPEEAAAGIVELFDQTLQYEAVARVLSKGYSPVDYALLCYGGGGPLHVAGYAGGVPYRDVLVPAWAAGFSAYGCACGDYAYRSEQTVDVPIAPRSAGQDLGPVAELVSGAWEQLRGRVVAEFAKSGVATADVGFRHFARMQYMGQLNDIEIASPRDQLRDRGDVEALVAAFEESYGKVYARAARSPELGYLITDLVVVGSTHVEKPALPDEPVSHEDATPKSSRPVWWRDGWTESAIYEQDDLRAGNVVAGPAIIESPADTFAVPPGFRARLDRNRIFHLEAGREV